MRTVPIPAADADPPPWATLERELIDAANAAAPAVLERYTRADGSVMWPPYEDYEGIDALDDAYESIYNWPLFYALGGAEEILDLARGTWEAITEQFADVPTGLGRPQVDREYQTGHDWFHQSEGNLLFYHLCMADPDDDAFRERARRFAGFYLNEAPDVPDIYDPETNTIRCPMNGSAGPAHDAFSDDVPPPMYGAHSETRVPWQYAPWKESYGLPFYDLGGIDSVDDLKDPGNARRMGEALRDRCARADTPQNLGATTLLANAFLLTGEERYREWVLEYVEGWAERADAGLVPDNVGPSGEVGETIDGRWYGGWYGWTWPHGFRSLAPAITGAAETATHLAGDPGYMDLPRSQFDELEERAREEDGVVKLPFRYADSGTYPRERGQDPDGGWFDYRPAPAESLVHLWFATQSPADRGRVERLRDTTRVDWDAGLESWLKDFGGNEYAWLAYLDGDYPDYPERVLEKDLDHVRERRDAVEDDDQDPGTYDDYYLARRNPVATEALVQLTTGAPQEVFNGGLPVSQVRPFDAGRRRPGLPEGVALLVTDVRDDRVAFEAVNVGEAERSLAVQAGGFGEHRFGRATVADEGIDVDGRALGLDLAGGARVAVDADLDRFAGDPAYAAPWDR